MKRNFKWRINWHTEHNILFPSIVSDSILYHEEDGVDVYDPNVAKGWHVEPELYLRNPNMIDAEAKVIREAKNLFSIVMWIKNDKELFSVIKERNKSIHSKIQETLEYILE